MSNCQLSIIVPVYNVSPYLRKCVDSLLAQDYEDYEIILVDDGSTDGSGKMCDDLSKKPVFDSSKEGRGEEIRLPLIRVIHQPNAGLSAARNAGLKAAKGEYVCFADSDDYWEKNVLGGLMEQVKRENLDVLRFDYQNVNEQYQVFEPYKTPRYIDRCSSVVNGASYLNLRMSYACYAVMYIIRREIVPTFMEGIHFEDVEWLPRMMMRAERVNATQTIVYNYLIRKGSITQVQGNPDKTRENIEDRIIIIGQYGNYIEQFSQCRWLKNMQSSIAAGVITTVARDFYSERKEYIARLKEMNIYPLSLANQGRTYLRRACLINALGARVYCLIIHTMSR